MGSTIPFLEKHDNICRHNMWHGAVRSPRGKLDTFSHAILQELFSQVTKPLLENIVTLCHAISCASSKAMHCDAMRCTVTQSTVGWPNICEMMQNAIDMYLNRHVYTVYTPCDEKVKCSWRHAIPRASTHWLAVLSLQAQNGSKHRTLEQAREAFPMDKQGSNINATI